jgi:guanylate kinase
MVDQKISFDLINRQPLMIVVSGPSGVGKDSVVRGLLGCIPELHFVVTATSRLKRENEVDGVDYIFLSEQEFEKKIADGEFIEHAWVYNQYKGIPITNIRKAFESARDVVLRLDVQGAATIKKLFPDAVLIFLSPRNEEELIHRLVDRGTETAESISLRMATTRKELDSLPIFDYVVFNPEGKLGEAVQCLAGIIHAEHHRVHQRKVRV